MFYIKHRYKTRYNTYTFCILQISFISFLFTKCLQKLLTISKNCINMSFVFHSQLQCPITRNYTDYQYHCLNNRVLKLEVGQMTALLTPQSGKPFSALAIYVSFQSPGETATLVQTQCINALCHFCRLLCQHYL